MARVLSAAGIGLLGGVASFALGFYGTTALPASGDECADTCGIDRLGWAVLGGSALAVAGLSLGTYAGAEWVGGDGSFGYTLLGGSAGSALALGLALFEARTHASAAVIATPVIVLPLAGATVGYELSAADRRAKANGVSASIGLVPVAGGASVGVSGRF